MEPRASTPSRRLDAIRALRNAGIPVIVRAAPIIPGLTDHEIEAILEASANAGARYRGRRARHHASRSSRAEPCLRCDAEIGVVGLVGLPLSEEIDRRHLASPLYEQGHDVAPKEAGRRDPVQQRDAGALPGL